MSFPAEGQQASALSTNAGAADLRTDPDWRDVRNLQVLELGLWRMLRPVLMLRFGSADSGMAVRLGGSRCVGGGGSWEQLTRSP
jgi:hypothetical protein